MREYQIYQLKDITENREIRFRGYEEVKRQNVHVDMSRYDAIYKGEMPPGMNLESIYILFNANIPDDFRGHSLSVSDVIVVSSDSYRRAYYVDTFGFSELPGFFDTHIQEHGPEIGQNVPPVGQSSFLPVYRHSAGYARTEGEIDAYLKSRRENIVCRSAIEETLRREFDGMRISDKAVPLVLEQFGAERVSWVLANTVVMKEYDGRFSRSNREWANSIGVVTDRGSAGHFYNDDYVVDSHPAILDGYISLTRKAMQKSVERQKGSVSPQREHEAHHANRDDRVRRSHESSL